MMANELDEMTAVPNKEGRDVNVIEKQLSPTGYKSALALEIILFCLLVIPGLIFLICKIHAGRKLSQLQQKIQHDASQIDNYLEQRVIILKNTAKLLDKAVDLDKDTFTKIAELRSGGTANRLNELGNAIENVNAKINVAMENYPDLKSHQEIMSAMQQNSYLQREITAAREVYNDTVAQWNMMIYGWPCYCLVAHQRGYTTRIPFTASKQVKEEARGVFF